MSSLLERLKSAGSVKLAATLNDSSFFKEKSVVQTDVPIINVAMTGALDGGLISGLTCIAGPSKHFKSNLGLIFVRSYLKKHEDAVCLFYDSEYGVTPEYVAANGVDGDRVIHIPIEHIEQLKFDIVKRLEEVKRGDKVIIFIDSIGNLASKKEVEDALDEKTAADMTRAKQLKSLFRIITPHLTTKDIPCVAINHTYKTMEMYAKDVMGGGTGAYYSANTIFIVGRQQEKDSDGVTGYNFVLNVEKSRFVKEKSKLSFLVEFYAGISRWSGLMDLALESGHCTKPKNGWYQKGGDEKNYRLADTNNKDFWLPILMDKDFQQFVKTKYQLATTEMFNKVDYADENDE